MELPIIPPTQHVKQSNLKQQLILLFNKKGTHKLMMK
jgi:hypothetical protein